MINFKKKNKNQSTSIITRPTVSMKVVFVGVQLSKKGLLLKEQKCPQFPRPSTGCEIEAPLRAGEIGAKGNYFLILRCPLFLHRF